MRWNPVASRRADSREESIPEGQRLSRRLFVHKVTAITAAALAGSSLLEGCGAAAEQPTAPTARPSVAPTTAPAAADSATLADAFKNRRSANAFRSDPLPREKLLDLLWAAWGINRPDSGKRTAPSAGNSQEMDLYVLLPEGTFLYDAQQNQLTAVSDQDLRSKAGGGKFGDAAVNLVFVADYAKFKMGSRAEQEMWSAAHAGFIGQNVYLFCAAEGLGARFYAGIDRAALKESLGLRTDQVVVFGQAVGVPNE